VQPNEREEIRDLLKRTAVALKEAGVLSEAEAGPFAALAQLKRSDSDMP